MSGKFTPGPWSYQSNGQGWKNLCGADGRSIWTASALTDEDAANRSLISAAPEMYEALHLLGALLWEPATVGKFTIADIRSKVNAAIAKAEGR